MVPFSQQGPPQATIDAATLKYVHSPVAETTRFVSFSFVGGGDEVDVLQLFY